MTDMTAFEQQLSAGFKGLMGPSEPVDDAAIFTAITATQSPAWRVRPLFSATRFVVAGVMVALFGGFVLAGLFTTQQGDEMAPAAVITSPSPMRTEELLSGMVTEEVEPGVFRVINDGARDLTSQARDGSGSDILVGPDGSVWLNDKGRWFGLGGEDAPLTVGGWSGESGVAPDGTVWAIAGDGVYSFDGESWSEWETAGAAVTPGGLAIGPDGTIWVTGEIEWEVMTGLYRVTDGSVTAMPSWTAVFPGAASPRDVVVAPDGAVWIIGQDPGHPDPNPIGTTVDAFLRLDNSGWAVVEVPDELRYAWEGQSFDIGPDGTVWATVGYGSADGLARLDGEGWTVFTEADGVHPWGTGGFIPTDHLHVAPDGSVWVNAEGAGSDCGGVAEFDGVTWTGFLAGLCVYDLDIAPDGAVWVEAGTFTVSGGFEYWDPPDTYVITPEAVTAAG